MSGETTPRQVLYALVAGGFVIVTIVLTIGAAAAGLVPQWWSFTLALLIAVTGSWMTANWRRTAIVLWISITLFLVWMIGTLALAR